MAQTVAELVARLTADVSGFKRGMAEADATLAKNAKHLGSLGKSMQDFGKRMTIGVSLPIAAAGLAAFRELESAGKVAAQTNAVLKSTGGQANVTASQVENLGTSLSRLSGYDDELIKSGANLLLTFKNVHNEAGRGNDIFNRATKAALDLSVAGFGDMTSTSKMLGKALNDPVRGLTALGRAGVTFTAAQKDAIQSLVETGDVLGAQKIIMKEVESQVGGSAAAYGQTLAGSVQRAKEELLNAGAAIMSIAAPAIRFIASAATDLAGVLESLPGPIKGVVGGLLGVAAVAGPALYVVGALARNFAALAETKVYQSIRSSTDGLGKMGMVAGVTAGAILLGATAMEEAFGGSSYEKIHKTTAALQQLSDVQLKKYWQDLTTSLDNAESQFGMTNLRMKEFKAVATENAPVAQRLIDIWAQSGQNTNAYEKALAGVIASQEKTAASTENASTKLYGNADAINKVKEASDALINAQLGVNGALLNVQQSATSYAEAVAKSGADSLEAKAAQDDYAKSIIAAGQAQDAATGATGGSTAGLLANISTVLSLAGTLNGPAKDAVLDHVRRLLAVPGFVNTIVWADTSQATAAINALAALYAGIRFSFGTISAAGIAASRGMVQNIDGTYSPRTALGGVFYGAQTRVIAEAGPEAVVPLSNPRRAAAVMAQAGLSGGGGTTVIVQGSVVTERRLADILDDALARKTRRGNRAS